MCFFKYIYLAALGLSCGTQDRQLWRVGSSSLTRDHWGPLHWEVLATVPAGKALSHSIYLFMVALGLSYHMHELSLVEASG